MLETKHKLVDNCTQLAGKMCDVKELQEVISTLEHRLQVSVQFNYIFAIYHVTVI